MMLKYSAKLLAVALIAFLAFTVTAPKTQAMEPISIAMMAAPIAIPIIKALLPYVIKGAVNMAGAMFEVGVEMCNMALLPVGLFETTLGAFWFWNSGVDHLVEGSLSFPKTLFLMLLVLPKTIGVM